MKKFMATAAVLAASAVILAGCGSKNDAADNAQETVTETAAAESGETGTEYGEDAYVEGINVDEYVTLGDYRGIEVSVDAPVVTDTYLESYIDYVLQSNLVSTDITDRPVEEGDIVNIDYEGKKDGVAFEGGTAAGTDLEIGSGRFIEGFEDGLIGAEIGETLDLNLTFPEDYTNEELAGAAVVFTVTVNSIRTETVPELTDEFVQGLGLDCDTVEEFRQYSYDQLMEDAKADHDLNAQAAVLEKVMENCGVQDPPEGMITRYYDRIRTNMTSYAGRYGLDLESFMALNQTTDEDVKESAGQAAREIMVMKAIADAENLTVSDEELDAEMESNAASYGYSNVEDYKAAVDLKGYREYMLSEKILTFLLEQAKVTDVETESEE